MALRPPSVVRASTEAARRKLDLAAPPFLDRPRHGHGTLAVGRVHPLLDACKVGRNPVGHNLGGARSSPRARRPGSL